MRDLSLHILDLIENSIRAQATAIHVSIVQDVARDTLQIVVEDNGTGISVPQEVATDPFYTTKSGKRVGLGLSLFCSTAEQAGGSVAIGKSPLGGASVTAVMKLSHLDRVPLGDIAATLSSVVCTNPDVELVCRLRVGEREVVLNSSDIAKELPVAQRCGLAVARQVLEKVNAARAALDVVD
jgi:hypothetical protein